MYLQSRGGPGSVALIKEPDNIESGLGPGNGDQPILDIPTGLKRVDISSLPVLADKPVDANSLRMQDFFFKTVKVYVDRMVVIDVPCVSDFCDALHMYSSGNTKDKCSCFSTSRNLGTLCLLVDFEVHLPGGEVILIRDFTSRKFTNMFLLDGIPPGVTAAMVNSNEEFVEIWKDNVEVGMMYVSNNFAQFEVLGWAKRGVHADQGAAQPPPGVRNVQQATVTSGKLKYHMTSLKINSNANGAEPNLAPFKVSLSNMEAVAAVLPPVEEVNEA